MAKIVDPDQLNQATEVVFTTTGSPKTFQLLVAGNLDDNAPGQTSGVAFQAFYSFCKEEWLTDTALNKHRFPIDPIFEAKFNVVNDWEPADAQTRDLLRDGGWREDTSGAEYAVIISLGGFDNSSTDQAYYQQVSGFSASTTDFDKTGELNEAIEIFDGSATDNRDFLKVYLREQGKTISEGNLLVDQDLSVLTYQAYRLPLSNSTDPKIVETDANIDANTPYTGMTINYLDGSGFTTWANSTVYPAGAVVLDAGRQASGSSNGTWWFTPAGGTSSGTGTSDDTGVTDWESYAGERQIGTEWYAFNRIIDGNSGSAEKIYEFERRELRRTTDINDDTLGSPNQDGVGTINGNIAVPFLDFLGETLQTRAGVYVDDFDVNDQNRIEFFDITVDSGGLDSEGTPSTSTKRVFPFVAAGNLVFSSNLVSETNADTLYRMYFTNDDAGSNAGSDFDTDNAIVVNDNAAAAIEGQVTATSIPFTYDYDGNVQRGGGSAATDVPVTVVAQGLSDSKWVVASFTITRATGLTFQINAGDELVYQNPV